MDCWPSLPNNPVEPIMGINAEIAVSKIAANRNVRELIAFPLLVPIPVNSLLGILLRILEHLLKGVRHMIGIPGLRLPRGIDDVLLPHHTLNNRFEIHIRPDRRIINQD
jgi:hypothetical protein